MAVKTPASVSGQVIVADEVISTIAGVAAREVKGVHQLGKGALRHALGRVTGSSETTQGIAVEVGKKEVAVDIDVVVMYGLNIQDLCGQVRRLVSERIEQMTGLTVKEVNLNVVDIHYEGKIKELEPEPKSRVE